MKTKLIILVLCLTLSGCASWLIRPEQVVLLPEERIFTIPAGQKISVLLDKKPIEMTFPYDMKLVSPTVLVRQEERLNDATLDKVKAKKDKDKILTIVGSIAGILAAGLGVFFKAKSRFPKKLTVEAK